MIRCDMCFINTICCMAAVFKALADVFAKVSGLKLKHRTSDVGTVLLGGHYGLSVVARGLI